MVVAECVLLTEKKQAQDFNIYHFKGQVFVG